MKKTVQAVKTEDDTPMMVQYQSIKKDYPDTILFFRMGDFYEMFNEDAKIASNILQIALTSRNKNKANPIPMCGLPHHSANMYISKLIKSGRNVAICDQTEDPALAKGLVRREVVRVITPGTILDDKMLDPKSNHFLLSIHFSENGFGLAALDVTTGLFKTTEFTGDNSKSLLADEVDKLDPKEIIVPESVLNGNGQHWLVQEGYCVHPCDDWTFGHSQAYRLLLEQFKTNSLEGFGCESLPNATSAAGALIQYLKDTQKSALDHINILTTFNIHNYMMLDQATIKSLELVQSSDGRRENSLFSLLDLTHTPMGARRVKEWILKPLIELNAIEDRLEIVEEFKNNLLLRNDIKDQLKGIYDLERLLGRISLSAGSPRDLAALKASLAKFPEVLELLKNCQAKPIQKYLDGWDNLESVHELIDKMIVDDPPLNFKDGHLIKEGCDQELDRLKKIIHEGKNWIASHETKERERSGINQLKVGYNKIYGYYIEITKKNLDRVPQEYIRKQSLVNAERFISPDLKKYESEISGAEEKIINLEQKLFQEIRAKIAAEGQRIQSMAVIISELDALLSFAEVAHRYNYCRPTVDKEDVLVIRNGRHPLIEQIDPSNNFIPNDTSLDCGENQIMIITGPNMAGKSTYLRQTAIITLMAQIGCFVPAEEAVVGLTDRIFSRVGAQDHLLKGQSTFMVEMNEMANILNNATNKSLLILDEIGRGTSTFDGISIAWAIVEHLHGPDKIGAKTLFATHYHELTELALVLPGVKNLNVQVKEWNDEIIFLRKIVPGGADKSYGIQVARLAGLPEKVLERAHEVLFNLENKEFDEVGAPKISHSSQSGTLPDSQQLSLFSELQSPLVQMIKEINPDDLTPRQALEKLYELVKSVRKPEE